MTWHCDVCRKEWTTADGCVFHVHRCIESFAGEDYIPRRRVPLDRGHRALFWALSDGLDPEELFRR